MAETVAGLKGGAAGEMMEGAGKDDNRVVTSRAIWRGGEGGGRERSQMDILFSH